MQQLSREVAILESKVGKGDYNRATTKVGRGHSLLDGSLAYRFVKRVRSSNCS